MVIVPAVTHLFILILQIGQMDHVTFRGRMVADTVHMIYTPNNANVINFFVIHTGEQYH